MKSYKHESGLIFDNTCLYDNEHRDCDITVVVIWLPNCAETPMEIIDWYCGEPSYENLKTAADAWCADKTDATLRNLVECQDIALLEEALN